MVIIGNKIGMEEEEEICWKETGNGHEIYTFDGPLNRPPEQQLLILLLLQMAALLVLLSLLLLNC